MALGDSKEVEGGRGRQGWILCSYLNNQPHILLLDRNMARGKNKNLKINFGRMGTAVEAEASSQGSKQSAGREAGPTCHKACLSYNSKIHVYTY